MTIEWSPQDTTTHQDHVIAHIVGATVLGYLILDETLHVLLDMGFIWKIYVDGEMGLLPYPVAISELEADEKVRTQITADVDALLRGVDARRLNLFRPSPVDCLIKDVALFSDGDRRKLVIAGEEEGLTIEMSLKTSEIRVSFGI